MTTSDNQSLIEGSIGRALMNNSRVLEAVFPILHLSADKPKLLIGTHPNGPSVVRTLPQFNFGMVRWRDMDALIKTAQTVFTHHFTVSGGELTFVPLTTHLHQGYSAEKLLVYIGVVAPPACTIELRSQESFTDESWHDATDVCNLKKVFATMRSTKKAEKHLKAIDQLLATYHVHIPSRSAA